MTIEELINNYEYKLTKRALMKEFPFIVDMSVIPGELETYKSSIFMNFYIDANKFFEITGTSPSPWLKYYMDRGQEFNHGLLSLSSFVDGVEDTEKVNKIYKDMEKTMEMINKSKVIPQELQLPRNSEGRKRHMLMGNLNIINSTSPSQPQGQRSEYQTP